MSITYGQALDPMLWFSRGWDDLRKWAEAVSP